MATDRTIIPAQGSGGDTNVPVASRDDASSLKHQKVIAEYVVGTTPTEVTAATPLPVVQTGTPALPTGAATATGVAAVVTALGTPLQAGGNVVVTSSALPTGAATETTLAAVNTKLGAALPLPTGAATETTLAAVNTKLGGTIAVSNASLPLPTGAATDATLTANGVLTGAVTETAPATDTASSGLNGRLQRIAQRLSTIIGVLPAALGANGGLKIEGVASGTPIPISGSVSVSGATDFTATKTVAALNDAAQLTGISGVSTFEVDVTGTFSANINCEYTTDGTTWVSFAADRTAPGSSNLITVANRAVFNCAGFAGVRARCSAYVSGSPVVSVRASTGVLVQTIVGSIPSGSNTIGAIGAGSAIIGKVGIDQTTPGTTNLVALAANQSVNHAQVAGTTTSVNSGTVDAGTQRVVDAGANTGTLSNVAASATSVTVLASNTARRGATVWNDSTSILYLKFGTTASTTSATVKMVADAYYEVPANYNGRIDGIWVSATGNARVTEITA